MYLEVWASISLLPYSYGKLPPSLSGYLPYVSWEGVGEKASVFISPLSLFFLYFSSLGCLTIELEWEVGKGMLGSGSLP